MMIRDYEQQAKLLRKFFFLFALCAVIVAPVMRAVAAPDEGGVLTNTLYAWKIVTQDGKEKKVPAESIGAGEVVQYEVVLKNTSSKPLKGAQATLPIPSGLEFIPGTAQPTAFKASVDGKTFASYPLRRRVRIDGQEKIVAVPHAEYRYLRWESASLDSGKSETFRARVRLAR